MQEIAPPLDLDGYLARLGLGLPPPPDADGLTTIQRMHRLSIPFENLDVRLGRGISLDPDHVFEKLVHRRRGGYCFEHNQLFLRALSAIGFDARPLLARVWLGATELPPKTHTVNLVRIEGQDWIADAGFGGSYGPPMPLIDGAEAEAPDGARFRLRLTDELGWMLERRGDPRSTDGRSDNPDWQPQYSFTTDKVEPIDLEMSNHWTSSRPGVRMTAFSVVSLVLPSGFAALTDRHYTRRNGDQYVEADLDSATAYRLRLNFVFGIALDEVEVMGLGLY